MTSGRVLLVDPDQTLIAGVRASLENQGHALRLAGSAAHALEVIGQGDVDVVLLSLRLPDRPAPDVVREIADRWPDVPVVVVTPADGRAEGFAARAGGAYSFLEPPRDLVRERLLTLLANALERRQFQKELAAVRGAAPTTLNLEARERQAIVAALESTRWNKQAAAKLLGLHRPTLYAKMRKHGVPQARPA